MTGEGSSVPQVEVRPYRDGDWAELWPLLEAMLRAGETYALPVDLAEPAAREEWTAAPKQVFVALCAVSGEILGTYYLQPNARGPGDHVANCGYVVGERARGRGIASRLCEHSQGEALARGFRAMQFNLVAASNEGAVRLWKKHGFQVVGTLPGAFRHPGLGFVDAYVMYKSLT